MALAMFVGCDNAPVLPSFVVSGNITQTGDFLSGQAFDPSKFSVTVTYDNGRIVAADETVSVMLADASDTTANAGEQVIAYLGKNYESQDVFAKAAIRAYDISSIAVEGPASFVGKVTPSNSDLKVTATYLDNTGAEKTMVLRSTEFDVSDATYSNSNIGPNASQESVTGYVTVTPLVGQEIKGGNVADADISTKFEFTATYEPAELPAEIADIVRISFKDSAVLPALKYEEMPVPSFDDFDIVVLYKGSDEEKSLEVDPGLEFTYLGMNYEALTSTDFTSTGKNYRAQVTYGDIVKTTTNDPDTSKGGYIAPKTVTLAIAPANSFAKMVEGTTLPELSADDFIIGAYCNNTVVPVDADKVELSFSTKDHINAIAEPSEEKVPGFNTQDLYVIAEYQGVKSSTNVTSYIVEKGKVVPLSISNIVLEKDYEGPARQYYKTLPTVHSGSVATVASFEVAMSDGTTKVVKVGATETNEVELAVDNIVQNYLYSEDYKDVIKAETAESITVEDTKHYELKENQIYVGVTYTGNEVSVYGYKEVATVAPYITAIEVTATPDNGDVAAPVMDSEVMYTMTTKSGEAIVDYNVPIDFSVYSVQVDGTPILNADALPAVTAVDQIVTVYANIEQKDGTFKYVSDDVTVKAGSGYVKAGNFSISFEEGTTMLIDKTLEWNLGKNASALKTDKLVLAGFTVVPGKDQTADTAALQPKLSIVSPSSQKIVAGTNTIKVKVSYTDETGETVEKVVPFSFTKEVTSWLEPDTDKMGVLANGKSVKEIKMGETDYTLNAFSVAEGSFKIHGSNVSAKVIKIEKPDGTFVTSETGNFRFNAAGKYTFHIEYPGVTGNVYNPKATYEGVQITL